MTTTFSTLLLNRNIFQAIDACGYTEPTEIQAKTIPLVLANRDVIGATETGSGKTAAYVLPALNLLAESKKNSKARILILTPTRELADQVTAAIVKYGKFIKLGVAKIIGGASYKEQERMLSRQHDIIVATPGRLIDHLKNKRIDLSAIEMFVLDEADRMLDMGFKPDVKLIGEYLPKKKQTLLFTATLDAKLINSVGYLLQNPVTIDLTKSKMVPHQIIQQLFIATNKQQKIDFLENLLEGESIFKGIIFAATKIGADKIAYHLRSQGHHALALHGNLKQRERKKAIEKLSSDKIKFLVATDIASRGIDIKNISHIINFDFPRCSDDYIHRVGRTGRAGKPGKAITIALKNDEERYINSIEKRVGTKLQVIDINREPTSRQFLEEESKHLGNSKRFGGGKRMPNKKRSYHSRGRAANK